MTDSEEVRFSDLGAQSEKWLVTMYEMAESDSLPLVGDMDVFKESIRAEINRRRKMAVEDLSDAVRAIRRTLTLCLDQTNTRLLSPLNELTSLRDDLENEWHP